MEPYVGEIRMFSGNYAPAGWLLCDGTTLTINDYAPLFYVIGTAYGGDGENNFKLPDLRGRAPMHRSGAHPLGESGGSETVTLNQAQLAAHTHAALAKTANGSSSAPAGHYWAGNSDFKCYAPAAPTVPFAASAIGAAGGNEPHENMMPFTTVTFIISTSGTIPNPSN